jgi:nitrate/nitrite-specific signal transduction histidine kinase
MKIKTRLKTIMLFSVGIVIIIAWLLILGSAKEEREKNEAAIADEIARDMSELRYLAFEYMLQGRERQKRQFQIKYDSIALLMRAEKFAYPEEKAVLDNIQKNYKDLYAAFSQIVANRERDGFNKEGGNISRDVEARLTGLFLVKSQEIVNDAFSLAKMVRNEERLSHERLHQMIIIISVALVAMILVNSFLLGRSIAVPLVKLHKGTEIIGSGNLDYKVGTDAQDEIGQLSRAFDSMTENLTKVMTSRDELAREVDERKKVEVALHKSKEDLERTNKELEKRLHEIKTLQGILPICSYCKKIRNDKGSWEQMEMYIRDHSEAEFSHGMCDDCAKKAMEEFRKKNQNPEYRSQESK